MPQWYNKGQPRVGLDIASKSKWSKWINIVHSCNWHGEQSVQAAKILRNADCESEYLDGSEIFKAKLWKHWGSFYDICTQRDKRYKN